MAEEEIGDGLADAGERGEGADVVVEDGGFLLRRGYGGRGVGEGVNAFAGGAVGGVDGVGQVGREQEREVELRCLRVHGGA